MGNTRFIISCLLAATGLMSCSGEHEAGRKEGGGDTPVAFGGSLDEERQQTVGTRAAGLETRNFTTFRVYGYKTMRHDAATDTYDATQTVFDGYTVSWTAGSAGASGSNKYDWEYVDGTTQTIKYWDYAARAYRFLAYAPATAAVAHHATADEATLTMTADATSDAAVTATPYYSLPWFSNNDHPTFTAYGTGVTLSFMQPLCRVRFLLVDEAGHALTTGSPVYAKTDKRTIRFRPADASKYICRRGSVTIRYPLAGIGTSPRETTTVTPGTDAADRLAAATEPYEETGHTALATTARRWYTLLPAPTQSDYVLALSFDGMERKAVVPATYMAWKPGFQYTYVFKLTDQKLSFDTTLSVFTKWQAGYVEHTQW